MPEHHLSRRGFLATTGAAAVGALGDDRLPFFRNAEYHVRELQTPLAALLRYAIYHEFSLDPRQTADAAASFAPQTWTITIDGLVDEPKNLDVADLESLFPLEERLYRFRTVTGVGAVIPWLGYPLALLLEQCSPQSNATHVAFTSAHDPKAFPNQQAGQTTGLTWPYREGLTLAEAQHPLTLLTLGLYGRRLPPHYGAPVRIIVPWKYSYKSPNALTRITLTDHQPATTWTTAQPREYDYAGNVDPARPHPRWAQATERRLDRKGRFRTLPYNGYANDVADLY